MESNPVNFSMFTPYIRIDLCIILVYPNGDFYQFSVGHTYDSGVVPQYEGLNYYELKNKNLFIFHDGSDRFYAFDKNRGICEFKY